MAQDSPYDVEPRPIRPRPPPEAPVQVESISAEALETARRDAASGSGTAACLRGLTTLVEFGSGADAPLFLARVNDDDLATRRCAFDGIWAHAVKHPGAVAAAVQGLRGKDSWIIEQSLLILGAQEPTRLRSPDPVTVLIVPAIGDINPTAVGPLFDILASRGSAAPAIAVGLRIGTPRPVTLAAVNAASKSKASQFARRIMALAEGRDTLLAVQAVKAVAAIEGRRALEWYIDRLEIEEREPMLSEVATALRVTTGQMHGSDIKAWRRYAASRPPLADSNE